MSEDVRGDDYSIWCPCGREHVFESEDGEPQEGQEIACECGRTMEMVSVDWHAIVRAEVKQQ